MKRILLAVAASLLLHVLILGCLSLIPKQTRIPKEAIDNYVEFVPSEKAKPRPDPEKEQQVVRKQNLPKELLQPDDANAKRRFLSEERQTVLRETRAADTGLTRNRSQTLPMSREQIGSLIPDKFVPHKKRGMPVFTSSDGIEEGASNGERGDSDETKEAHAEERPNLRNFGLDSGRSTFGESAPNDIKIGEMTALNSDRFLYYSFYERAQDLIYPAWEKYIRAVLYSYMRSSASTGDEMWETRIEVILDRDGKFVKALVEQGSGLAGLDLAPVHAFREAHRIPNPPAEMVGKDGFIHMDWAFDVRVDGRVAGR